MVWCLFSPHNSLIGVFADLKHAIDTVKRAYPHRYVKMTGYLIEVFDGDKRITKFVLEDRPIETTSIAI